MDIKLKRIKKSELKSAWLMQKRGFLDVFLKYFDRLSPVLKTYQKFCAASDHVDMYWIIFKNRIAGEIWICTKENIAYLANIFVLKPYRNQGVAQQTILKVEGLYPDYDIWRLDTIKQEKKNCRLYEKLGYLPTGEEHKINRRMTIINYEKRVI